MVPRAAWHILRDVSVDQPGTISLEIHIGVANIRLSFAEGFYLCPMQDNTCFQSLQKMIVVACRAILRDNLFPGFLCFFRGFGHSPPL